MSRCYAQLTLADRRRLHHLVARKVPINEMARQLGRHRSTIYREIRRNTFQDHEFPEYSGYFSTVADDIAKERRRRLRKLRRHPTTASSTARKTTGLVFIGICPRRAASVVRVVRGSRATACFLPTTRYRNVLILLAIDRCLDTGKVIF